MQSILLCNPFLLTEGFFFSLTYLVTIGEWWTHKTQTSRRKKKKNIYRKEGRGKRWRLWPGMIFFLGIGGPSLDYGSHTRKRKERKVLKKWWRNRRCRDAKMFSKEAERWRSGKREGGARKNSRREKCLSQQKRKVGYCWLGRIFQDGVMVWEGGILHLKSIT